MTTSDFRVHTARDRRAELRPFRLREACGRAPVAQPLSCWIRPTRWRGFRQAAARLVTESRRRRSCGRAGQATRRQSRASDRRVFHRQEIDRALHRARQLRVLPGLAVIAAAEELALPAGRARAVGEIHLGRCGRAARRCCGCIARAKSSLWIAQWPPSSSLRVQAERRRGEQTPPLAVAHHHHAMHVGCRRMRARRDCCGWKVRPPSRLIQASSISTQAQTKSGSSGAKEIWQTRVQCLIGSEALPRSTRTRGLPLASPPPRNSSATDSYIGRFRSRHVQPPSSER